MKKIISLSIIILAVLISSIYISHALVEKTSVFPKITIKFSKTSMNAVTLVNVSDIKVNLTDETGRNYPLEFINVPEGGVSDEFELNTTVPLGNGNYTLYVFASDIVGNTINTTQTITVDVPYMDIRFNNPPLSVSPTPVFDFSIETEETSYGCKYDSYPAHYEDATFSFPDITSTVHTIANFNNASANTGFGLLDGKEKPIYIFCIDVPRGRINPKTLKISYDTTPPKILSLEADPEVVTDRVEGKIRSTLRLTSDDKAVCRYSDFNFSRTEDNTEIYTPIQDDFSQMPNYFGSFGDESNESKYVKNPSTTIDLTDNVTDVSRIYKFVFNVACINRATFDVNDYGPKRVSDTREVTISVNLLRPLQINKISPPSFTQNSTLFINITTNRLADCSYVFNETSGNLESDEEQTAHTGSIPGEYPEGTYTLEVSCVGRAATSATREFSVTIDKSPPSSPSIISPNATCSKKMSADFSAVDNQSGIRGYNYSIIGEGVNVTNKFTSSSSATEENLNLSNHTKYYFTAVAVNNAGLSSTEGRGNDIVYDETGVLCDKTPPSVFLRQNTTATRVIVTLVCIDAETSCNNLTYEYQLSDDANCTGNYQSLAYDSEREAFAASVSQEGYFCYRAEDVAGNVRAGAERIKFESSISCSNNIQDGGETDVDCGGETTCVRCDINENCEVDSDCTSNYCFEGICQQASCSDQMKNGHETDVDCGGFLCPKCSVNQSCERNSDCQSGFCAPSTETCQLPSCNDNITNGNETDVDCGGPVCNACARGKFCEVDSDCITNSCFGGKCVQEPLEPGEAGPAPVREEGLGLLGILKVVFLILGALGILGGSGYLFYKKHQPTKPSAPAPGPAGPPARPTAKPEKKELTPEEKIKRMTVQEQLRREREEKEKKRKSLFEAFGAPKKGTEKKPEKLEPPKKPPVKKAAKPAKKLPLKRPAKKAPEKKGVFEKLGKVKKEAEDYFEKLGKLKGETEFEKLERVGRGKKEEEIEKLQKKKKKKNEK